MSDRVEVPQFNVVEAVTPVSGAPCAQCRGPIVDSYYECDQAVICATCHARIADEVRTLGNGRFVTALAFGLGAAVVGSAIYFAVVAMTGYEIGLVAILVGFLVGKAVRHGSRGRGGRRYQWLAAVLTYFAIVSTYIPFVVKGFVNSASTSAAVVVPVPVAAGTTARGGIPDPVASSPSTLAAAREPAAATALSRPSFAAIAIGLGGLLLLAAAAPVLAGFSNIIGIAIIGFALMQAWRMNRRVDVSITGPYHIRSAAPGSSSGD